MNKKDIALTVGGIIASMVVAYLIFKMEQKDSAANLASQELAAQNAATAAQNSQYEQQSYLASMPSISVSSPSGEEDVSAAPVTSATPSEDPTLAAIVSAFGTNNQSNPASSSPSSSLIPSVTATPNPVPANPVTVTNSIGSTAYTPTNSISAPQGSITSGAQPIKAVNNTVSDTI